MPGFLELFGGVPCLDFANTVDGRATARPEELVHSYADLVRWAGYAGLIDAFTEASLYEVSAAGAEDALRTALELREAIFQVFVAVGGGDPVPEEQLAVVQRGYSAAMAAARLVSGSQFAGTLAPGRLTAGSGENFHWQLTGDSPHRVWWPVAVSAVELLMNGPLDRVKVCAAEEGCLGVFLDTSKNRSRRWCSMGACGVEAKVQRQAVRRRRTRPTG